MAESPARHESVECPHCRQHVVAGVRGSVWLSNADWLVSLAECPKCEEPLLIGQDTYPPDEVGPARRLWPEPSRQLSLDSPPWLRNDFAEAQRCYVRGDFTVSAIMTRRCLEGIVNDRGADGRDLAKKLADLEARQEIDGHLAEWAAALRGVGNEAAHDTTKAVAKQDAEDALVFVEALAEHLYTIRARYEAFMARRATE